MEWDENDGVVGQAGVFGQRVGRWVVMVGGMVVVDGVRLDLGG